MNSYLFITRINQELHIRLLHKVLKILHRICWNFDVKPVFWPKSINQYVGKPRISVILQMRFQMFYHSSFAKLLTTDIAFTPRFHLHLLLLFCQIILTLQSQSPSLNNGSAPWHFLSILFINFFQGYYPLYLMLFYHSYYPLFRSELATSVKHLRECVKSVIDKLCASEGEGIYLPVSRSEE